MTFAPMPHPERQRALAALGMRAAAGDNDCRTQIAALATSDDPWERWLAALAQRTSGDIEGLRHATHDSSRLVRATVWKHLLAIADDHVLAELFEEFCDHDWAPKRAGRAISARSLPAVEALVDRLATPERPDWLDIAPMGSRSLAETTLNRVAGQGSIYAFSRLARRHPRLTADHLLTLLTRTAQHRSTWRAQQLLPALVKADPDAALDVVEALFDAEGQVHAIRTALKKLTTLRPVRTFDLVRSRQAKGLPAPLSGLFSGLTFRDADRLGVERLVWAVHHAPDALPQGSNGRRWLARLSDTDRHTVVNAWLTRRSGAWGAFLLAYAPQGSARQSAFVGWRHAACNKDGVLPLFHFDDLPWDLRHQEARRHLTDLPWLQTRPPERMPYARFLPFTEAEEALRPWIRHPEGDQRLLAWPVLIATVRHDRSAGPAALARVRQRKNEQDPVRMAMLTALASLPSGRIPNSSNADLVGVVDEALDAADLSPGTAAAAQRLAIDVLQRDPAAGVELLTRILRVRGNVSGAALGVRLTIDGAKNCDLAFAELLDRWVRDERAGAALSLTWGLQTRIRHMPATLQAIDGLCASPHLPVLATLLALLRAHARDRFAVRAMALLDADPSAVCLPDVARYIATVRTDRLDAFLGGAPMQGRFATGKTHWVLDFGLSFIGFTPAQQARYADQLDALIEDPERDVPTCRWALERRARLPFAPSTSLIARANDPRPPIRDMAIRALPGLDDGGAVSALIDCMGDDRARIATYALRRALKELPRDEIVAVLQAVPLTRVTVAKEVLRMLGNFGGNDVVDYLVAKGRTDLHRDVRIALFRALWDHIERPDAWALLEAAATSPDPILVSRLMSIPMGRLSVHADARLCALFGQVLARQEPEARVGFLNTVRSAPLNDNQRVLFARLLDHLDTPDPDEAAIALTACLYRMHAEEVPAICQRLVHLLTQRRHAAALLTAMTNALHHWAPAHHRTLGEALLEPLLSDRHAAVFAIRLLARLRTTTAFATGIERLIQLGHWHHDAVIATIEGLSQQSSPDALALRWLNAADPRLRRVGLAALQIASGPQNGWTTPRRSLLEQYRVDPSVEVSAAAAWVFPPPL